MFQFTTTTVINSAKDSNGTTDKFTGTATEFFVTRVNRFKKDNIVYIAKKAYSAGEKAVSEVTLTNATAGRVLRLVLDIRLQDATYSDYAGVNIYFNKPLTVEILSSGVAATDATALVKAINDLRNRFGEKLVVAEASGAKVTITAIDNHQRFHSLEILTEDPSNTSIVPEYIVHNTGKVVTLGKVGFGDDSYMIRSIMVPTPENTRAFGINAEERPILGGKYHQYTIKYKVDKGLDGIWDGVTSVTTHVFYVLDSLQSSFETELLKLQKSIESPAFTVLFDSDDSKVYTVENIGTVTYSKTGDLTVNSSTGEVTGTGTSVITATDDSGNTSEITVTLE